MAQWWYFPRPREMREPVGSGIKLGRAVADARGQPGLQDGGGAGAIALAAHSLGTGATNARFEVMLVLAGEDEPVPAPVFKGAGDFDTGVFRYTFLVGYTPSQEILDIGSAISYQRNVDDPM